MNKENKVMLSFVTPNYNDGKTIARMVDSIMDQDYKYIEQIIVDDGSTDGSQEILKKLEKKYAPKLKVIFLEKNQGACVARNIGAKEAKGKYISFLPADAKLYPGVARIWVETLEENPEYDFLYGGYKFTDDNYHEIYSYLADSFDPYFLKIANYIDGSFPLKKELFDKMGGWDPAIKSLQDWDLWLNAVINHNAKGLFKKEVFFETTYPHPGGLSDDSSRNWIDRVSQIKKKYNIPEKRVCVAGPGATFHAKNIAKMIEADYQAMPSFKPHNYDMIYVVGFFGNVAQCFWNTRAMRVVHWIGSDIMMLRQSDPRVRQNVINWLDNNVDVNLCEMEETRKELEEIGIKARIVPLPPAKLYESKPLPEKPAIAVYSPYQNKQFYLPDLMRELALENKQYDWYFFGDTTMWGQKDNITHCGDVNGKEKDDLIYKTSLLLRVTPHDGMPLSAIEWITAGRRVVSTINIPYAGNVKFQPNMFLEPTKANKEKIDKAKARIKSEILRTIKAELKLGENKQGSEYYSKEFSHEKFSKSINGLLDVDIKKWWENMAGIWEYVAKGYVSTDDMLAAQKAVRELGAKSILDIGCGNGMWSDVFDGIEYTGIDFSKGSIETARKNFPDKNFEVIDFMDYKPGKKFDVAFTFTCLLHTKPEDIKSRLDKIKEFADYGVFIEPIRDSNNVDAKDRYIHPAIIEKQKSNPEFIFNVKYTWVHDYVNLLNVQKVVQLPNNRNLFVVKLN